MSLRAGPSIYNSDPSLRHCAPDQAFIIVIRTYVIARRTKHSSSMKNEATLQFVQLHREDDVNRLAFLGDKNPDVDMPWALAQISGWQTARRKLPSWAACDGLEYPPHLNMEQCSSEPTAIYKASLASRLVGADAAEHGLLVDLTGGFGVDFSWMARAFAHAVYVERNETLCPIAQHNFQQLGLGHVEIHVGDGVAYLQTMPLVPERTTGCSHPLTLIYLDPARRDTYGRKVFGMEDCTPDVVELCDTLLLRADIVVIKLSPMLDWHEAVRKLKNVSEVHVVSVSNECKELLLVLTREKRPLRVFCVNDGQTFTYCVSGASRPLEGALRASDDALRSSDDALHAPEIVSGRPADASRVMPDEEFHNVSLPTHSPDATPSVLLVPNSSIMKAGCFREIAVAFGVSQISSDAHLYLSNGAVPHFPGRQFRILRITSMNKRDLRQAFQGVSQANIAVRHFPLTADALRRRLKLKDGGSLYVFATTIGKDHRLILTEKLVAP